MANVQDPSSCETETLALLNTNSLPCPSPWPHLYPVSLDLTHLGAACKRSQTVFVLLRQARLTVRSVLRAHLPYSMRPNFFPLSEGLVFRCEYRCPALGLCIFLAHCKASPPWAMVNDADVDPGGHVSAPVPAFSCFGHPWEWNGRVCGRFSLTF